MFIAASDTEMTVGFWNFLNEQSWGITVEKLTFEVS